MKRVSRDRGRRGQVRGEPPAYGESSRKRKPKRDTSAVAVDHLIEEAERHIALESRSVAIIAVPALFEAAPNTSPSCVPWIAEGLHMPTDTAAVGVQIVLPERGQLRARKVIGRSRRVMTGKYPSWKMGRMMHWESRLEAKVLRLLDACPAVERFAEQPFTILYLQDGRWRAHVPDVVVQTVRGDRWILEVKSDKDPRLNDALHRAEILKPRLDVPHAASSMFDRLRSGTA